MILENHAYTNTPITITTGFHRPPQPPCQLDGRDRRGETLARGGPRPGTSRIPRASCHLKGTPNGSPNAASPATTVGTAISLATHNPAQPELQNLGPCRAASSEPGGEQSKSTRTSTFTSQSPEQGQRSSRSAALIAFRQARPPSLGNAVTTRSMRPKREKDRAHLGRLTVLYSGVWGETENRSSHRTAGENRRKETTKFEATTAFKKIAIYPPPRAGPTPDQSRSKIELVREVYRTVRELAATLSYFVAPVFNPHSAFRQRWARQEIAWQDVMLLGGTGILGIGTFLAGTVCARILSLALLIVRVILGIFTTVAPC